MRTHDVGSYSGEQSANAPGAANDSKQFTRVFRGCKVKSFELKADAEAAVMMKVDFDALSAYTDTGRMEDEAGATATISFTDEDTAVDQTIIIISADTTSKTYTAKGSTTAASLQFDVTGNNGSDKATALKNCIDHSNGHTTGKLTVTLSSDSRGSGNNVVNITNVTKGGAGNTIITSTVSDAEISIAEDGVSTGFSGGMGPVGDRYTAHRMFENIGNGPSERKVAGIAPNTEKPFFYYNGTITAFGIAIAQITNFSLSGTNGIQTLYTVRGNPQAESRNASGESLEQVPFAGSRNASLQVEGKVEYEMNLGIIVTDPLLFHEFRTNRTHGYSEPITLHLVKNGAGSNREEVYIVIDDYIISEAPLQIPEDKGPIKSDLKILPKHVKVIAYDTLLHS